MQPTHKSKTSAKREQKKIEGDKKKQRKNDSIKKRERDVYKEIEIEG